MPRLAHALTPSANTQVNNRAHERGAPVRNPTVRRGKLGATSIESLPIRDARNQQKRSGSAVPDQRSPPRARWIDDGGRRHRSGGGSKPTLPPAGPLDLGRD